MTNWLHEQRFAAVVGVIRARGARSVLDLGCGEGDLLLRLARDEAIDRITGVDISEASLATLRGRLAELPAPLRDKVRLVRGSMTEADPARSGYDIALLVETIEHVDPDRLSALERAVFGGRCARTVVVTTPNGEFNPLLGVPASRFRHPDHRFEWDRAKFAQWTRGVARRSGYRVTTSDIGGAHPRHGGASQMAVFTRDEASGA